MIIERSLILTIFVPLLIFFGLLVIFSYTKTNLKRKTIILLSVLRIILICSITLILLNPSRIIKEKKIIPLNLPIVIDNSKSMSVKDGKVQRMKIAKEFAESIIKKIGSHYFDIDLWQLNVNIEKASYENLEEIEFKGDNTEILSNIRDINNFYTPENTPGIIFLSDGIDNVNDMENFEYQDYLLNIPVYIYPTGKQYKLGDAFISDLYIPDNVVQNESFTFSVKIGALNMKDNTIIMKISDGKNKIFKEKVTMTSEQFERTISGTLILGQQGQRRLHISLQPSIKDVAGHNNNISAIVNVFPEERKVLYVEFLPYWDFRFIKNFFEKQENIDLYSYMITDKKNLKGSDELPDLEDAIKDINKFNLVIIGNINLEKAHRMFSHKLSNYVDKVGGSLLFIGGTLKGKSAEVEKLIPVKFYPSDRLHEVNFQMSESIKTGTLFQDIDFKRISNLPPLTKSVIYENPSPGSQVLAQNMSGLTQKGKEPVLVFQRYGQGKILFFGCNEIYKWFLTDRAVSSSRQGEKLFSKLTRMLLIKTDLRPVRLRLPRKNFYANEEVKIDLSVYNQILEPVDDVLVSCKVVLPDGSQKQIDAMPTLESGKFEIVFFPEKQGEYQILANVSYKDKFLGKSRVKFKVTAISSELTQISLNYKLLNEIAIRSNGKIIDEQDFTLAQLIKLLKAKHREEVNTRKLPVWTNVPFFIFILLAITLEWLVRRRNGLL